MYVCMPIYRDSYHLSIYLSSKLSRKKMVNKSLDSEIFMNKNNKCRFSYLYLLHNDLTKKKIIIIIANKKHSSNDNKNYNNSNNIANNNKMT